MPGTYYETDRLFGILFIVVVTAILYAALKWDEKRQESKRSYRAEKQRRTRNERKY